MAYRCRSVRYYFLLLSGFAGLFIFYRAVTVEDVNCSYSESVTFVPGGELGDIVCQYAHLKHLQLTYNLKVGLLVITDDILSVFPELSVPVLPSGCLHKTDSRKTDLASLVSEVSSAGRLASSAIITGRPCDFTLLWPLRETWQREFEWPEDTMMQTKERLQRHVSMEGHELGAASTSDPPVLVGVDVRRYDDEDLFADDLLPPEYYHNAFNYYRKKFPKVLFLVLSDDLDWSTEFLVRDTKDVALLDYAQQYQDLAILSSLPHVVLSHGAFGMWAALLSNAHTIVYPDKHGEPLRYSHHSFFDQANLPNVVPITFT